MEDSLKVLNYKEDTMASGKQKGINNIDNSDIPGKLDFITDSNNNNLFYNRSKEGAPQDCIRGRQIS